MDIDFGIVYIKPTNEARIKVTLNTFRGIMYLHIREYGMDGDTGKLFPTPKGISLDPGEVDSLIEVLEKVSKAIAAPYQRTGQLEFNFDPNKEEQ